MALCWAGTLSTHCDKTRVTRAAYAEPPVRFEGGYFTENHAFRLTDAPPPWDRPLVVRLFPSTSPSDLPRAARSTLPGRGFRLRDEARF